MDAIKNLLGLCMAAAVGFAGAWILMVASGGACSPTEQFFVHPIDALLSIPPPSPDQNPYGMIGGDGLSCGVWPPAIEMWLLLWLPLCAAAVAAGFLAAKLATSPSRVRAAIASAIAITTNIALVSEPGPLIAPMAVAVLLTTAVIAGLFGIIGVRVYRQYHPDKQEDSLLQHPERLEQMLDETDDA
jgi:hypothetical protein